MDRTKLLVIAGYNTFFWMCFWLFCYWTFPYQRVAAFLTDKVAESGAGYTLEIGELAPHWISGVELKDVKIRKVPPPGSVPPLPQTSRTRPREPPRTTRSGCVRRAPGSAFSVFYSATSR